jgi:transposase-like protein
MSVRSQRAFSTAFKERIVLRLQAGERLAAVADELGIRRKLLYQWRHAYRRLGVAGLNRKRGPKPGAKSSGSAPGRLRGHDKQSLICATPIPSSLIRPTNNAMRIMSP